MGDYTYCTLTFATPPDTGLIDLIERTVGEPCDTSALLMAFDEVNHGALPDVVASALIQHKLTARWAWGCGDEYLPGVTLFCDGKTASYNTDDQWRLVVPVEATDDAAAMEEARYWLTVDREITSLAQAADALMR